MKKYFYINRYRSYLSASFREQLLIKGKRVVHREFAATCWFFRLLTKWLSGKELDEADKRLFKKQLLNYSKILPLATLFVLPFGTLLLILVVKFFPLNMFPTAFVKFTKVPLDSIKE